MSDEKSFQYVKVMLPLFRAVVKLEFPEWLYDGLQPFVAIKYLEILKIYLFQQRDTISVLFIQLVFVIVLCALHIVNEYYCHLVHFCL